MLRRFTHWLLQGNWTTIERWWYTTQSAAIKTAHQKREAELALRDFKARMELVRMRDIVNDCREQSARGAAISTALKIVGDGLDPQTTAVILQRLYFLTSAR